MLIEYNIKSQKLSKKLLCVIMFGVEDFESLFVIERSMRYTRCRY